MTPRCMHFNYQKVGRIAILLRVNILVALKVWHNQWACQKIVINCDNQAVVSVLNIGRSRDNVMGKYARNLLRSGLVHVI